MDKYHNIPDELKELRRWIFFQFGEKKEDGRYQKVPYTLIGMQKIQTNPTGAKERHLMTFAEVDEYSDAFDGIGYVFKKEDGFVGVDLDKVRDPSTGAVTKEALEIIELLNSYTEISPSGRGFHIICRGSLPQGKRRSGFLEMYEDKRFFTMTGDMTTSKAIRECTHELGEIHRKYLGREKKTREKPSQALSAASSLSVWELVDKARKAKNGAEFSRLFDHGDYGAYGSQSEADLALCNMLAFWTNRDAQLMDEIFRESGLYRDKWDEKHSGDGFTYGQMTINRAIDDCIQVYTPKTEPIGKVKQPEEQRRYTVRRYSEFEATSVKWLWYPYIPFGKVSLVSADPGTGKTWLCLALAAAVSSGAFVEDETSIFQGCMFEKHPVLYQSAEDGVEDTLLARLNKIEPAADYDQMMLIDSEGEQITFGSGQLDAVLEEHRPMLIIFDPMQAFIGATVDMNRANQTRPIMSKLSKTADKYGCAIVIIVHQSKMTSARAQDRILGSIDIIGTARSVLTVVKNPQVEGQLALCHTKSSLAASGQTILYHIDPESGGLVFDGYSSLTADDITGINKYRAVDGEERETKLDKAKALLRSELRNGPKLQNEIAKKAEEEDIDERTLQRAKKALGVYHFREKKKHAQTVWSLEHPQVIEDREAETMKKLDEATEGFHFDFDEEEEKPP